MSIFNLISMLGGLALFLYGMRVMGDGLKAGNSATLQKVLEGVTNNAFKGFLLGLLVTALIQSSKATIVLAAGLVGAGILTARQSIGIMLGANVGTTATGQIIRLLDLNSNSGDSMWLNFLKPNNLAPIAAVIGIVLIMFIRSKKSDTLGSIAMGFGILFTGLMNMSAAVAPLSESPVFVSWIARFADRPVLAFFVGVILAAVVQSSSASVGMLQTLSTTGVLTFSAIYPVLLGIFLGDAITTMIMCSIGTRAEARRTGLSTVIFNIFGFAFLMVFITLLHSLGALDWIWGSILNSSGIANTNSIFKLIVAGICIPFSGLIYKLTTIIIREEVTSKDIILDAAVQKLDEKLYMSPKMAIKSAHTVISVMQRLATSNFTLAMEEMQDNEKDRTEEITRNEECIDRMADAVDDYLIHFPAHLMTNVDSDMINYFLQCYSEVERVGDHAVNLMETGENMRKQNLQFTGDAARELEILGTALQEILEYATECFADFDMEAAAKIEPLEEVIDDLVAAAKKNHIKRLRDGQCTTYTGLMFVDALTDIERISDQCSNIAVMTLGMHNAEITHNRHEYIQKLHEGGDEFYNQEYARQQKIYIPLFNGSNGKERK